ncbi:membrane protein [Streptomyces sp. NRRL WC-3618]|uniref:peptidoglycan-binding protein n=1 Tax=Streptomyces sp. NRRL WC-3618 TaxID=1519490 RepID=UPI0006ADA7DF|nr:peptidoglycan-binding protein [Streptomyces sp. NRRL WC-3618]KOV57998.1 membrane protein [Streptomyces sp. NRRL WC-3618]
MATPVFEEFDPASDCECPGCVHGRRAAPYSGPVSGSGPGPARTAVRRTLVVAAAASTVLAAGHALPAAAAPQAPHRPGVPAGDEPDTPQGGKTPLHGPAGKPAAAKLRATTRAEIVNRARTWVAARVPYSMSGYWGDGYRQDCSGFVSMAWNLAGNEWTGSLDKYGVRIPKEDLQPGDILLFHNPSNAEKGSHVVIFGGWTDYTHTYYIAYEETRPHARRQATPFAYWSHSDHYQAYRYKGLAANTGGTSEPDDPDGNGGTDGPGGTEGPDGTTGAAPGASPDGAVPFPGRMYFGPGANNRYVTLLGRMLVERGAARYYTEGPGPRWSDADRRATRAFQRAQGWTGASADGLPGPRTWALLVSGTGRDIEGDPAGATPQTPPGTDPVTAPGTDPVTAPGTDPVTAPGTDPETPTGSPPSTLPGSPAPGAAGPPSAGTVVPTFPGRGLFRPGASNPYVTQLGEQLVTKGFGRYYPERPDPRWDEADRRAVQAFQRAQGWRGGAADGYPGPETWRRLFSS